MNVDSDIEEPSKRSPRIELQAITTASGATCSNSNLVGSPTSFRLRPRLRLVLLSIRPLPCRLLFVTSLLHATPISRPLGLHAASTLRSCPDGSKSDAQARA